MKNKTIILIKILLAMVLVNIVLPNSCIAQNQQENILDDQQELLGISDFLIGAEEYSKDTFKDIDFKELFNSAVTGNIDNKTLINKLFKIVGKETIESINVIASVMIVIIIHSIIKSLSDGLENKSVSQIIYYFQYILIVTLIMQNFSNIIVMIKESIDNLVGFMNSLVPILITLTLTTGNIASAGIIQPIILFVITFIGNFITKIIIPFILVSTSLGIISKVSDRVQIEKLSKYIKSGTVWILGIVMTIFVGLLSVEGSLSSSVDGITAKTAKAAVSSFVPVVGKILRRCCRYGNRL